MFARSFGYSRNATANWMAFFEKYSRYSDMLHNPTTIQIVDANGIYLQILHL